MFNQDQEVFNILLETVSEGVIIVDNHENIMEINTSAEHIFGYTKKEIIGRNLNILLPSNYHEKHTLHFAEFVKKCVRRKMSDASDIFGLKKDGNIFPVEIELNPFKVYNKSYVMALVKDVSEFKEIEIDLMLKSNALQSASNGILITDAQKHDNPVIYFNSAFQRHTGYADEEILNQNCRFLQGTDRDQVPLNKLRVAIKNGESCQVTLRNYKKDGTLFWNELSITPITDSKGVVTNFIGIQNDVTQRKKIEEERLHLATIFDESLNEVYVFGTKTLKFVNVNYGALKNIGYSYEELMEMTPIDIKPAYNDTEFRDCIGVLLKRNVQKIEFETFHKRKDGSTYPVEVHLQLSNLGEREVFVSIILDITERKNYTTKLENTVQQRTQELQVALSKEKELNDLKTKFLSLVSHEFKTPLSGILTSTFLLSKYQLQKQQDKRDKHINIITDKVHYLNNILNDFLTVEKLETGKINYKFSNFKLSKVVNEVVYNTNMLLKEGQRIKYPEKIDHFSMFQDEKIIELVLSNILHNAVKYSSENTVVDLIIKQDKKTTFFKIKDEGIGIPEKDIKHIFERYFRAGNVANTQGTGIGLNIVKNHVENLGGSISFTSKEKKGTTFTVTLPNNAKR